MNFLIGLIAIFATTYWSMIATGLPLKSFYNFEGLVMVGLGTISIFIMSNRFSHFIRTIPIAIRSINKTNDKNLGKILVRIAEDWSSAKTPKQTGIHLVDKGIEWISVGLSQANISSLCEEYSRVEVDEIFRTASTIKNLSKYPPALGMMGTVLGLLGVFSNLNAEEGAAAVGIGLAIALTSTLYGLVVTNFLISPMAELIYQYGEIKENENALIKDTLMLISEGASKVLVKEFVGAQNEL